MSGASPLRVGSPWAGYNEKRNFLDLPVPGVRFVRVRDRWSVTHALRSRFTSVRDERVRFRHGPPSVPAVDVLHFFNSVSTGRTPWVVSFETSVPRGGVEPEEARRLVESTACRRLLAMSACARDLQLERWERDHGDPGPIASKLEVLHPAQAPLVADLAAKPDPAGGVRFVFVGRHFFRKGGRPLLQAFDTLLAGGADVHLHVVSSLEAGDRWSRSTAEDAAWARGVLGRHPDRIRWDRGLPHAAVLDALRGAHVLLLPTLADTYGYSVLEGQAAGCACVTTDVRALPEINTAATGWTIPLELSERRGVRIHTDEDARAAEATIRDGVLAAVREIVEDPGVVLRRGAAALARVRAEHDPVRAAERLAQVYAEAAGGG